MPIFHIAKELSCIFCYSSGRFFLKLPLKFSFLSNLLSIFAIRCPYLPFFSFLYRFQEYTVDMYLRQTWMDPRLKHSYQKPLVLPPKFIDKIWIADLFFSNEKSSYFHDVTVPNRYIRIAGDGEVLYSVR